MYLHNHKHVNPSFSCLNGGIILYNVIRNLVYFKVVVTSITQLFCGATTNQWWLLFERYFSYFSLVTPHGAVHIKWEIATKCWSVRIEL